MKEANTPWAASLIGALAAGGVNHCYIAPGSRSTPLVLAAASHPSITCHLHFDERGLAFQAVGHIKASGEPVSLITTSGTATGNLLPGIMEADQEDLPLIVMTADRPPECHHTGAPQTL
ncbi:MAG: thiamine pyrophosphate-binding protein, partial [Chlamydiota bacterium]|nr:thiamine pyrophosphate-binding protein [Chlamydiota bacterium]